jgi:protocatechuate 3,4-dioxygenase beta subunit
MGPFYPTVAPHESRADLTRAPNHATRAIGPLIEINGIVRGPDGKPLKGALVLVWQANAAGRYGHPRDNNTKAPIDPGFLGHALMRTGADGAFAFLSVKPGAYPDTASTMRTPHIHYEIIGEEGRLITQMYFPGEPGNETDRLLNAMRPADRDPATLIARASKRASEPNVKAFDWDITMERA